jgi:hypothetical protein
MRLQAAIGKLIALQNQNPSQRHPLDQLYPIGRSRFGDKAGKNCLFLRLEKASFQAAIQIVHQIPEVSM